MIICGVLRLAILAVWIISFRVNLTAYNSTTVLYGSSGHYGTLMKSHTLRVKRNDRRVGYFVLSFGKSCWSACLYDCTFLLSSVFSRASRTLRGATHIVTFLPVRDKINF